MKYIVAFICIIAMALVLAMTVVSQNAPAIQEPLKPVPVKQTLILKGSNTVGEHFAPLLTESFLKSKNAILIKQTQLESPVEKRIEGFLPDSNTLIQVEIRAHGSSTGFKALEDNTTHIAMSSRRVKQKEKILLESQYSKVNEFPIALDALAIVTYPDNPVNSLTVEQVARIFSGEVKNWSELGGDDLPIGLFSRDEKSGTWDTFRNLVLKRFDKSLSAQSLRFESSKKLIEQVTKNVGSIGFVGVAHVGKSKLLSIANTENEPASKPGVFTIGTENYPLSRKLYLYTAGEEQNELSKEFIQFVNQDKGQKLAEKTGLVSFYPTVNNPKNIAPELPLRYKDLVVTGKRITVDFPNTDLAENKSKEERDISRIENYIRQNSKRKIVLVDFSESTRLDKLKLMFAAKNLEVLDTLKLSFNDYRNKNIEVWIL